MTFRAGFEKWLDFRFFPGIRKFTRYYTLLLFTIQVRLGAITLAEILRIFGPILSIPVDLLVFNRERKFLTKVSHLSGQLGILFQ